MTWGRAGEAGEGDWCRTLLDIWVPDDTRAKRLAVEQTAHVGSYVEPTQDSGDAEDRSLATNRNRWSDGGKGGERREEGGRRRRRGGYRSITTLCHTREYLLCTSTVVTDRIKATLGWVGRERVFTRIVFAHVCMVSMSNDFV